MLIAPSILNADNLNLENDIKQAVNAGISRFHIDIMDGHFVPNLSFGPQLVSDFKRKFPEIEVEIHLMSDKPDTMVPAFVNAGADLVELHYEAMNHEQLVCWLSYLALHHVKAGLVLNPETPISVLKNFSAEVAQVLLMTVHPGFGGQKFIPESVERIKAAKRLLGSENIPVEVDGGINTVTIKIAQDAGAEVFVAGSAVFGQDDIAGQVKKLTEILS